MYHYYVIPIRVMAKGAIAYIAKRAGDAQLLVPTINNYQGRYFVFRIFFIVSYVPTSKVYIE